MVLAGSRKGSRQSIARHIFEQSLLRPEAALEMALPRATLARLGVGKIKLAVGIDGVRLAQRTIRTPTS